MATATIHLSLDADQARADIELLADAAKRSCEVRQRLLDLGDFAPQVVRVGAEGIAASGASHQRFRLELPDAVLELARAVRAGEFDGLAVEE